MPRSARALMLGASSLVLFAAGCGSDDARQAPRPAQTIVISAQISPERVSISPLNFGAGRITLVIANGTDQTERLAVTGPKRVVSDRVAASQTTRLTFPIGQGVYRAGVVGEPQIKIAAFHVGPLRHSSDNQVLLP